MKLKMHVHVIPRNNRSYLLNTYSNIKTPKRRPKSKKKKNTRDIFFSRNKIVFVDLHIDEVMTESGMLCKLIGKHCRQI